MPASYVAITVRGRPDLGHRAVLDEHGRVAAFGERQVVRDQDQAVGRVREQVVGDPAGVARVQVGGRLVGDDQVRAPDERAAQGEQLLLAAGQVVRRPGRRAR